MALRLAPSRPAARLRGAVVVSLAVWLTAAASVAVGGVYTESGPDGVDGAAGSADPGSPGMSLNHTENGPDLTNSVTLNGGNGGAGGSAGGSGGYGGFADATAGATNPIPDTALTTDATAIGGTGGNAQGTGQPGRGGDALASTSASTGVVHTIDATALAFGGAGGDLLVGYGNSAGPGGNAVVGAQESLGDATLELSLTAIGGAGGNVLDGTGNGGIGGAATYSNVNATSLANDRGATFYTPEMDVNVALVGGSGGQGSGIGFRGGDGATLSVGPLAAATFGTGTSAWACR